jgi:ribonucleoside-diphosphate reductase alpha chain
MTKAKQPRPNTALPSETLRISTAECGNCYATLTKNEGKPFELFLVLGKSGGCRNCMLEAIGRLVSWGLRSGASLDGALEQLKGLRCPSPFADKHLSCLDGIAQAIKNRGKDADAPNQT